MNWVLIAGFTKGHLLKLFNKTGRGKKRVKWNLNISANIDVWSCTFLACTGLGQIKTLRGVVKGLDQILS